MQQSPAPATMRQAVGTKGDKRCWPAHLLSMGGRGWKSSQRDSWPTVFSCHALEICVQCIASALESHTLLISVPRLNAMLCASCSTLALQNMGLG